MHIDQLRSEVVKFRKAIEDSEKRVLPITFAAFPKGSCGDASLILGTHLAILGFGQFTYILGDRGDQAENTWESHAWVETEEGIIIDITADQFPEKQSPVIVANYSQFHQSFRRARPTEADYRIYDVNTRVALAAAHAYISKHIVT